MVGLEKITDKIISDAQAQANDIISEANEKCRIIKAECEQRKKEIEASIEADAVKEGESIKMRAKSGIAMNRRDTMLKLRAGLIDEAFKTATDEILNMDTDGYRALLAGIMTKVMLERAQSESDSLRLYGENISPDKYEVLMNKKDKDAHGAAVIDAVRRKTLGKLPASTMDKVVLSDRSVNIDGGFIIKCGDIELNCSIRMLVEGIRPGLETAVADALFVSESQNKN